MCRHWSKAHMHMHMQTSRTWVSAPPKAPWHLLACLLACLLTLYNRQAKANNSYHSHASSNTTGEYKSTVRTRTTLLLLHFQHILPYVSLQYGSHACERIATISAKDDPYQRLYCLTAIVFVHIANTDRETKAHINDTCTHQKVSSRIWIW
jgi:hypothetical protein